MKKLLSYLFLLVAMITLTACQGVVSVESIEVSGQKTEFVLGDSFETGEIKVVAYYTNGNEEDVTNKVRVTPSTDMSAAGTYSVEVYFEGVSTQYNITIEEPQLVELDVNHSAVDKEYMVGEELSTEGLVVTGIYENSITGETQAEITDYVVKVKDAENQEVSKVFEYAGEYTVNISYGGLEWNYAVSVSNEYASVSEAIAAGVANAGKVASGTFTKTTSWSESVTTYAFNENYFTYGDEYGTYHYSLTEDGTVVGAYESDGYVQSYDGDPAMLAGCNEWVLYYTYSLYGAEGFAQTLYEIAKEANEVVSESIVDGVYSYAYNHTVVEENWDGTLSYYYFSVSVSFKLGLGAEISELTCVQSQYSENQVVVAEDGSWTVVEDAVADDVTEYVFVQAAGEKTAENPYSPEKVIYSSFDLVDAEGNAAATEYNIMVGEQVVVYIGNALPETANSVFNEFQFDYDGGSMYAYVSDGVIYISVYSAGTYVVAITTGSIVKEVTINAQAPAPERIVTYVYEEVDYGWGPEPVEVEASEGTVEAGSVYYVKAAVYPERANQEYTYECPEGASLVYPDPNDYSAPYDSMKFVAENAGTYVIVFTSVANPEISAEMTITVTESTKEPVTLDGTWTASFTNPRTGMKLDFELVLNAEGTGTLNCYNSEFVEFTYTVDSSSIAYTVTNGWTGALDGCTFDLLNATMNLTISTEDYGYYPLTFEKEVESEEEATLVGEWTGSYPHHMNPMLPCAVNVEFFADGTGAGTFNGTEITFSYVDNGGIISFTNVSSTDITFTIGTYTEGYESMTIFLTVFGVSAQATLTK